MTAALAAVAAAALVGTRLDPMIGGALTLLVTGLAVWLIRRQPEESYWDATAPLELSALLEPEDEQRRRARWFVHMRMIAIVVSFGLILIAGPVSHFLPSEAVALLAAWWLVLLVANFLFLRWVRSGSGFERQIVVQGVVDLVVLTGFLNASGGIENPVYFVYLFHVIIAGILLPRRKAFGLTGLAALLFLFMVLGEYAHLLPHFTNQLFPHEGELVGGHAHPGEEAEHAAHGGVFVLGRTLPFLTLLILSAYLTSLIADRLRRRESQLERAGKTLMLEHQRLEWVVDATGVGIMLVAPDLTIPWATDRANRWLELGTRGSNGRCPLYKSAGGCSVCIAETSLTSASPRENERSVRSRGGGWRYFRHATSPVRDAEGRTVQVVELIEDITDRKALEAEAVHAGKLSALGQMAAGVAHEIGNPLSSLATRLSLLERRPEPDFVHESVALLKGQIERIRRIVHGISLFARSRKQDWTVWRLNDAVAETVEIVRLDRRVRQVRFTTRLAEPSPLASGVKDQIVQVILNLLLNAAEASPGGGEVIVETEEQNGRAVLRVTDDGVGISRPDQARLFQPFFSTKEEGTGLGLAICFSLVNAHGGSIAVDSEEGQGATFTVSLPHSTERESGREHQRT